MPTDLYYEMQGELTRSLLQSSRTIIACDPAHEQQIFGYVTYTPDYDGRNVHLHYVYVKLPYRRFGIARGLLETMRTVEHPEIPRDNPVWFTHFTSFMPYLKQYGFRFNPFLLRKVKANETQSTTS